MAEEEKKSKHEHEPLSPEEAEKVLAEAEAARSEARKNDAETEKLKNEAALAEAKRQQVQAEADAQLLANVPMAVLSRKAQRDEDAEMAKDSHHHVYRFHDAVTPASVGTCVSRLTEWSRLQPKCEMEIQFFSPGGYVHEGMALYDFLQGLRRAEHKITTACYGYAASMAGILLQAGDHRVMGKESYVLIHEVSFGAGGKTSDIEDEVEFAHKIQKRIINIFAERSDLTAKQIATKWKRKDWWLDSDECMKLKLVDAVR